MAKTTLPPSTLILGGARSGKSRMAEEMIERVGGGVYIATAQVYDTEMSERVATHQSRRGALWQTIEEPYELTQILQNAAQNGMPVLVDCLTLWLTNLMLAERDVYEDIETLAKAVESLDGPVVFVSNEVGLGIVPDNAMAREFRDIAGTANQRIAQACAKVIFVAAGCPLVMKDIKA